MRALLAALVLVAAPARGDEEQARAIYHEGEVAYQLGHFAEAAARFEKAYALTQGASILFDVAQSYRLLYAETHAIAHLRQAIVVYRAFLRTGAGDWERRTAEKLVGELSVELARAEAPPPPPIVIAPAAPAVVVAREPRLRRWRWPIAIGAAALAVAVAGTGLIGDVSAEYGSLETRWRQMPTAELQGRARTLEAMANGSYALFAIAGTLALVDVLVSLRAARGGPR